MLGYHFISYLINASMYLVKGGRLDLMSGVLFHSCCPNFHHIGVMFPDFVFLTRLGYNGNPLIVPVLRIRSTTLVHRLLGFSLLPSGISGKMTITLDITSIFAC